MRISHLSIWKPSSAPWSFALNSGAGEISELALADHPESGVSLSSESNVGISSGEIGNDPAPAKAEFGSGSQNSPG
jgi:hypothetical protein